MPRDVRALEDLLRSLFEVSELKRFLRGLPDGEALWDSLPVEGRSKADLAHDAAWALERRGAGQDLFAALRTERPSRAAEIDAVAAVWAATPRGVPAPPPARAPSNPVRVLHLSDLHFDARRAWDRDPVLLALCKDVARLRLEVGELDLVVITGDIAQSGKAAEYALAEAWLRGQLGPAAGLGPERIRVVAGNHDVDREAIDFLGEAVAGRVLSMRSQDVLGGLLDQPSQRAPLLQRQAAFLDFARRFHGELAAPWWSEVLELRGWRVQLAGLNSALLCASDRDRGQLALGRWMCNATLTGADEADLVVALLHHPWDYLAEWDLEVSDEALRRRAGVILSGHLHQQRARLASDPDRDVLQLAAGACYAGSAWANAYQLLELDPGRGWTRVHFRAWDGHDWIPDRNRYQRAPDGVAELALRRSPHLPPEPPPPRGAEVVASGAPAPPRAADPFDAYAVLVRDRADTLPAIFKVHRGPSALSRVYVKVEVSARLDALRCDDEAAFGGAHRELRHHLGEERAELPSTPFSLEEVARSAGARWALLGDPGSGKTTLLRHTALELLRPGEPLPIYLRVSELRPELSDTLSRAYGAALAPWLVRQVEAGRAVLLIDGLDEAADRDTAMSALRQLGVAAGACPVVVASRPIGFRDPWNRGVTLAVCPLGLDEQRELLLRWVGDPVRVDHALETLSRAPRLRRLAENPLMLTLAGLVLREGGSLPRRRGDLYERAVDALLRRTAGPEDAPRRLAAPTEARELLSQAALALHSREADWYRTRDLVEVFSGDVRALERIARNWQDADRLLSEVAEVTGLLIPERDASGAFGYSFPHRTFREFLAACALEADLGGRAVGLGARGEAPSSVVGDMVTLPSVVRANRWWEGPWRWFAALLSRRSAEHLSEVALVSSVWQDLQPEPTPPGELGRVLTEGMGRPEQWAEVLALTCGRLDPGGADALVRRIAAHGSTPLLLRVVADAEGVSAATVREVLKLETGWHRWEARRDVIEQIPALVGDPGVAVGLLEQVVRSTTDGNDLYWARRTLLGLASLEGPEHEDARRAARAAVRGLFDHLADRRAEALAALEGLWRDIPAGRFVMGSPEGESVHAFERPQHEVVFRSGFQMMSVPVTWRVYQLFDPGHGKARIDFGWQLDQYAQSEVPVYNVTWYASKMFAEWLGLRLPSQAAWEYACRAGTNTRYWSGDTEEALSRVGWYHRNSGGCPHPVGKKPGNPWGMHDVHGNVWEWCADLRDAVAYHRRRAGIHFDPAADPGQEEPGSADPAGVRRVLRGGAWTSTPVGARAALRNECMASDYRSNIGFRLVRPVLASEPASNPDRRS